MSVRQALIRLAGFHRPARPAATPSALSLATAVALLFVALLLPERSDDQAAAAQSAVKLTPAAPQRQISFRDRLVVGLKALRPSEVAYIENVVVQVQNGRLPQRMVDQTFFWSRDRAAELRDGRTRRPIIYFQPALTARARQIGVTL